MHKATIERTVQSGLCHGCGVCAAACPAGAIHMKLSRRKGYFIPCLDKTKCIYCGVCVEVCPGLGVDYLAMYERIFSFQPADPWLGVVRGPALIARSADADLRREASSGGIVTGLLLYALSRGIISGAIVCRMQLSEGMVAGAFLARSALELKSAKGSKYCPTELSGALRDIAKSKIGERFAVVGLPCHIQGIRKLQQLQPKWRERISLLLGLMCSGCPTALGTSYFLMRKGIKTEDVVELRYRGDGWLGQMAVQTKNGRIMRFPRAPSGRTDRRLHASAFHTGFMHPRCLLCQDHMAEFADVSFGDPRYSDLVKNDRVGHTLLVRRTAIGEELIQSAITDGVIAVYREVEGNEFYRGQNISIKRGYLVHVLARRLLRMPVPADVASKNKGKAGLVSFWRLFDYLPCYMSHYRWTWPLLSVHTSIVDFRRSCVRYIITSGKWVLSIIIRFKRRKSNS